MLEFVEYKDDVIQIRLPKQLRQRLPLRFFRGNLVRGKPKTSMLVAIDLDFDDRRVAAVKAIFQQTQIENRPIGNKVERLGSAKFGEDGQELLTSTILPNSDSKVFRWDVFCRLQGRYAMIVVTGNGCLTDFESV